jgi:hypothetical protein
MLLPAQKCGSLFHLTVLVALTALAPLSGCVQNPRWEAEINLQGAKEVTVRAPLHQEPDQVHLEHLRTVDGADFPLTPGFVSIEGLTTTGDGRILVGDRGRGTIVVLDSTGTYLGTLARTGPAPFEISQRGATTLLRLGWLEGPKIVVVDDWLQKILLVPASRAELPTSWSVFPPVEGLACGESVLVLMRPFERPFFRYNLHGTKIDSFGRALSPDDAAWPVLADAIAALEDIEHPRGRMVNLNRLPNALAVVGDSLLIHNVPYRNSIRSWHIGSGAMLWQLNVESPDYEPPTLYKYQTSGSNELARWSRRGPPEIFKRDRPMALREREGLLYVVRSLQGYGNPRKEPDHRSVTAFPNEFTELTEGTVNEKVLDVFSLKPDWIAHTRFEAEASSLADVAPNRLLVLAFNDPAPKLELYRIVGLEY